VGRQEPLHNRLRELTMPVLVIAGELDQKYRELGEYMADSIPNAQFRIIPQAGHAPHWECPTETAAAVAEFIESASRT
jgi:pimeloyl-ACP methyl ester carboxylesterase